MMLDQLAIHESREDYDPHWDMRLDIDDMSYEVVRKNLLDNYYQFITNQRRMRSVTNVTFYAVICRSCWLWENE